MVNKQLLTNFLENELKKLERKIENIHERMDYTDDYKEFNKLDIKRYELEKLEEQLQTLLVFRAGSLHLRKESKKMTDKEIADNTHKKYDCCKKVLDEIKEIVKVNECENCEESYEYGECDCCNMKDILDIINKAKDGEE